MKLSSIILSVLLPVLAVLFVNDGLFAQGIVSGRITKANGIPIGQTEVYLEYSGGIDTAVTDGNGGYSIYLSTPGPVFIQPSKYGPPGGHLNGVTLQDTSILVDHILGIEILSSPYLILAGDLNQSFSLTTFDIAKLADIIHGIDSNFVNGVSWRYLESTATFTNPQNPFFPPGSALGYIVVDSLNGFSPNNDFIAIKMGDVNLDADGGGANDFSVIRGSVQSDLNADCLNDTSEIDLQNWLVRATNSSGTVYNTFSDEKGEYTFYLLSDTYTIESVEPNNSWAFCTDSVSNVVLDSAEIEIVNFSAGIEENCSVLSVSLGSTLLRRCFPNAYSVYYRNDGTITATGAYVEITFDPFLIVSSSSIPWTTVNGQTYTFPVGDIPAGGTGNFTVGVSVSCDAVLGQTHCSTATILPASSCDDAAPELGVQVNCDNDQVVFQVENTGADMTEALEYVIIEDIMIESLWSGTLQLNGGQTQNITIPANGSTWRIEVWSDGTLLASAAIEGCGGFQSLGFINQFPLDDAQANIDEDCRANIGAYDPNDKQGFPLGVDEEKWVPTGQRIDYLIRFQNTGTDTAFTVLVRDTLSELLDLATLTMGAGSHTFDYKLTQPNVLEFLFSNIMLPDSNVNEPASHGFVRFSVAPRAGLPNGTEINNSAAIYFDFNQPVITNTTKHTFGEQYLSVSTFEKPGNLLEVQMWPNPATDVAMFDLGDAAQRGIFRLYNSLGVQVQEQRFVQSPFQVPVRQLPAGTYVYRLENEKGMLMASGLVVK